MMSCLVQELIHIFRVQLGINLALSTHNFLEFIFSLYVAHKYV